MYLKTVKINLMWSRFGPFWSVKYLHIGQKLSIRTTHHTFLENRHHEVTKTPYYVLFPKGNQKKVSAHGLTVKHMCSLLLILIKARASDVTSDNKFIFLVSTTKMDFPGGGRGGHVICLSLLTSFCFGNLLLI